jgi:hypothetical protein
MRHLLLSLALLLSGCANFELFKTAEPVAPIVVQTKPLERTKLDITEPAPLQIKAPKWILVTPDNIDTVWKRLAEQKADMVLFSLTDDGYETLALDMAEIRNFISTQRMIIQKYKEYYEPKEVKNGQ